jgi:two-component system sensor histidine kinase TctE
MLKTPAAPPPPDYRVQRSLFGEILDWMLAPLLVLWPMSLGLTWVVAQSIASGPFDRELADVALALARQATELEASGLADSLAGRQQMQRTAEQLVHNDDGDEDNVYFQVLGRRGELLAGDPALEVPIDDFRGPPHQGVSYRDDMLGEEPVRVAYVWLRSPLGEPESDALVQVAETMGRRSLLATEIIKGVILPQFVILPVAVVLVWFALARGIRPLAELQQRIRRRQVTDLSPIDDGNVPDEVAPLVAAINDLLQRLDASIATQRHFLADAAHQLKTPLAGLRTQAELAAREIESGQTDPALLRHSLLQIALSTQRAAHMVNQLLAMARAEDGGEVLRRVPLDLAVITRAVVRDFVANAFERGIDLGYEGPDGAAPLRLLGEPVLLSELIRNLVDNALRYTPAGGTVTARVLPDPFGQVVVLQVEDTGPGIAPAERAAVFRPFYRSTEVQVDGSGLGLAIVQEIAQRHNAEVELADARPRSGETEHLPGALFTVRFAALPAAGPSA